MKEKESRDLILSVLAEKARVKQLVNEKSTQGFDDLKKALQSLAGDLRPKIAGINKSLQVEYSVKGESEVELSLSGDTIVFLLHSNVFTFDRSHEIWKSSYVKEDNSRSFCGQIYVYNFLSDSIKYSRSNDVGYLIARIYINKEGHYFTEGKRQLGFLYNDFSTAVFNAGEARKIVDSTVLFCLDFDPFVPPFDTMGVVSVEEVLESSLRSRIATGKRLGFTFRADTDLK